MAFKMKGSPMKRNFGIGGSGMGQKSAEEERIADIDLEMRKGPLPPDTGKKYTKEVKDKGKFTKDVKKAGKKSLKKDLHKPVMPEVVEETIQIPYERAIRDEAFERLKKDIKKSKSQKTK
jgi:hypothetical protein